MSTMYTGARTKLGVVVEVKIYDHKNRARTRNLRHIPCHSPDGFEMGYEGSGPADLALAILVDYFGEQPPQDGYQNPRFSQWTVKSKAWRLHQPFKRAFVAKFGDKWTLYSMQIHTWLKEQEVRDEEKTTDS